MRARVRLLIEITAQSATFRNGLLPASLRLSREEATAPGHGEGRFAMTGTADQVPSTTLQGLLG